MKAVWVEGSGGEGEGVINKGRQWGSVFRAICARGLTDRSCAAGIPIDEI